MYTSGKAAAGGGQPSEAWASALCGDSDRASFPKPPWLASILSMEETAMDELNAAAYSGEVLLMN